MQPKKKLLSVLVFAAGLLTGCGEKIAPGTTSMDSLPVVKAPSAVAVLTSRPLIYEAVGTVRSRTSTTLSGKIVGAVEAVLVKEGDRVKQDQVLLVLDARQVTAQLNQAEAGLAEARKAQTAAIAARDAAQAQAQLARVTYQRYLNLIKEESTSRQEFDQIEAGQRQSDAALSQSEAMINVARHRVAQADAAVSAARVVQKDAKILAPYDGTITRKMVDVGDLVSPGKPLFELERQSGYRVDLELPESHIQAVNLKQQLTVVVPALEGRSLTGLIDTIVPAADPGSRTFLVKVSLPEVESLKSGMFARVAVPLGRDGLLLIPATAVVNQGQLTGIFMLDDDRIARFRLIRTGRTFGDMVEVLSGLTAGMRYVKQPPPKLVDGARVEDVS